MSILIKRSSLIGLIGMPIFLGLCIAYYFYFSDPVEIYVPDAEGVFQYALNIHDHMVYLYNIEEISSDGIDFGLNNDVGISLDIYNALHLGAVPILQKTHQNRS